MQMYPMRKRVKRGSGGERKRTKMWKSLQKTVKNLRKTSIVLGISNIGVIAMGGALMVFEDERSCKRNQLLPFFIVMAVAGVRVLAMIRCAIEQQAAAIAVLGSSPDASSALTDNLSRQQRRVCFNISIFWLIFLFLISINFIWVVIYLFILASVV